MPQAHGPDNCNFDEPYATAVKMMAGGMIMYALTILGALPMACGLAAHFDGRDLRVISHSNSSWSGFSSSEGTTLELWVRCLDNNVRWNTMIHYSSLSAIARVGDAAELSFEIGGFRGGSFLAWRRKSKFSSCRCTTVFTDGYWHHVVATLSYETGTAKFYVNGTLITEKPGSEADPMFRTVPPSGGDIIVGMGLSASTSGVNVQVGTVSSIALDDLRIHKRILSESEVHDSAWMLPPSAPHDSLALHWAFDDMSGYLERDLSGNCANGLRGGIHNVPAAELYLLEQPTPVSIPAFIAGADKVSPHDTSLQAIPGNSTEVLDFTNDTYNEIPLLSWPSVGELLVTKDGEDSMPATVGQDIRGSIVTWTAPMDWPMNPATNEPVTAEFSYQFNESEVSVKLCMAALCLPPSKVVHAASQTFTMLRLGQVCGNGEWAATEILSRPSRGQLFEFVPKQQLWPYDRPVEVESVGNPITEFPAIVNNTWGDVIFLDNDTPPASLSRTYNVTLKHRWVLPPYTDPAAVGTTTISVEVLDQPPALQQPEFTMLQDGCTDINLWSTGAGGVNVTESQYRIVKTTKFGSLYQVKEDNKSRGNLITAQGDSRPVLKQFADRIPDYSPEFGPAFSSQQSLCRECCDDQATCNAADCLAAGFSDFSECINGSPNGLAKNMLGPPPRGWPDIVEDVLDEDKWMVRCMDCGDEYIVVGFSTPVFATQIDVMELSTPGSVVRLSVASNYRGNATDWHTVWSDAPKELEDRPRTFSPSICPYTDEKVLWVRIDLETSHASGWRRYAAVALFGTFEGHNDWITNVNGNLKYIPSPGITFNQTADPSDSFMVAVSDCSFESDPDAVVIPSQYLGSSGTAFGSPQLVTTTVGNSANMPIDLSEAKAHLSAATDENVPLEEFRVEVSLSPCFQVWLGDENNGVDLLTYHPLHNKHPEEFQSAIGSDGPRNCSGFAFDPSELPRVPLGSQLNATLDAAFNLIPTSRSVLGGDLWVWASARGVTYSLLIQVQVLCDPEDPIEVCADGEEQCGMALGAAMEFSAAERLCVPVSTSPWKRWPLILSCTFGAMLLLILAVSAALFASFRMVIRKGLSSVLKRTGPPMEGESLTLVITDIQGSTTLWDAFPNQVANDIALHHNCMRAALGQCSGYEVATEGDSFKCAFHTPEDALTWCIMVQVGLLGLPWSKELEEGGDSILSKNPDWASVQRQTVEDHCREILDGICNHAAYASTKENRERKMLKALSRTMMRNVMNQPVHPSLHESVEWTGQQLPHNMVKFEKGETKLLPIFRGLRVRMGVHTGVADVVKIHENTRRVTYGGKVAEIAKAVSDTPCGSQIIITGETMAEIRSISSLMARVADCLDGWKSMAESTSSPEEKTAMTIMHLGSHIIRCPLTPCPEPDDEDTTPLHTVVEVTEQEGGSSHALSESSCDHLYAMELGSDIANNQKALEHAHELLEVIPWPLRHRAMYYPEPSSIKQVTAPWYSAPSGKHVTIVFTFIAHWKEIKAYLGESHIHVVDEALYQHNLLLRSLLIAHNGYEMEGEDGSFLCAFKTPFDALDFSMDLQLSLMRVDWSDELLAVPMADERRTSAGQMVFRGLCVKVGMCTGNAARTQVSLRTGRIEYFGPLLNHAARVAVAANGGQVLIHEQTVSEMRRPSNARQTASASSVLFSDEGKHHLKGIQKAVHITQAIPKQLAIRQFSSIKTLTTKNIGISTSNREKPKQPKRSSHRQSNMWKYIDEVDQTMGSGNFALDTEVETNTSSFWVQSP